MRDGGSRDGRRAIGGSLGWLGQMEMGALGTAGAKGLGSSNLGFVWGRRPKVVVHETEATSRCSGSTLRRFRGFISQRRDVPEG